MRVEVVAGAPEHEAAAAHRLRQALGPLAEGAAEDRVVVPLQRHLKSLDDRRPDHLAGDDVVEKGPDRGAQRRPELHWKAQVAFDRVVRVEERLGWNGLDEQLVDVGREQRFGTEWVYLDVGAYNGLMESAQTKATWAFPLLTSRFGSFDRDMRCTITGPTCDASDTIFFDAPLRADICEGDRVYIGAAAAYTLCYASSFNGFPPPTPIYFDGTDRIH